MRFFRDATLSSTAILVRVMAVQGVNRRDRDRVYYFRVSLYFLLLLNSRCRVVFRVCDRAVFPVPNHRGRQVRICLVRYSVLGRQLPETALRCRSILPSSIQVISVRFGIN